MQITDQLLAQIADKAAAATPVDIRIGAHWTLVTLDVAGEICAGLSSTLGGGDDDHHHGGRMPVRDAGQLLSYTAAELVALAHSHSLPEASVGYATLNALLDVDESACVDVNAADVIAEYSAGKKAVIVGHFPFIPQIKNIAETLWVLELRPREGDLPAEAAPAILPQADVVALTGTSLLNHTFEDLVKLCRPDAFVVVLGATSPLSPVLFDYGVDAISGTVIVDSEAAALAVSQGATFKQIPGKRLLTMFSLDTTTNSERNK